MPGVIVGGILGIHVAAFAWGVYRDWTIEPVLWVVRIGSFAACAFAMWDVYKGLSIGIDGRWLAFGLVEGALLAVTFFPGVLRPLIWLGFGWHVFINIVVLLFVLFFKMDRLF